MRAVRAIHQRIDRQGRDAARRAAFLADAGMRRPVHQVQLIQLQDLFLEAARRQEQGRQPHGLGARQLHPIAVFHHQRARFCRLPDVLEKHVFSLCKTGL
ncbi:hypothetical protein G6F68_012309 [Rhizopus microsporus]|nr:hypothetical protein G6F68_012309 [Rhizopus microsporus]